MGNKYETTEGTEPDDLTPHEPRTIKRTNPEGAVSMMTEIEDGIFVAWSDCATCRHHVSNCTCKAGPMPAKYILRWRDERFEKSLRHRRPSELRKKHARLMKLVQEAQDAADGDSNDAEIDLLRDALEEALTALGLTLPESNVGDDDDPHDTDGNRQTPDWVDDGLAKAVDAVKAAKEDA